MGLPTLRHPQVANRQCERVDNIDCQWPAELPQQGERFGQRHGYVTWASVEAFSFMMFHAPKSRLCGRHGDGSKPIITIFWICSGNKHHLRKI